MRQEDAPTDTRTQPDILSPRDVASWLGLHRATITRLRQRGDFPAAIRLSPGRVGYRRVDVDEWLANRERRGA